MDTGFDPYYKWLGIAPSEQPPNHYRLLGVNLFESDSDVIESAADQRMVHLRSFQTGQNSDYSQRLLNEVAAAKLCLLKPDRRLVYDRALQQQLAQWTPQPAPSPQPATAAQADAPAAVEHPSPHFSDL